MEIALTTHKSSVYFDIWRSELDRINWQSDCSSLISTINTKPVCHSERSEEPEVRYIIRFLASLGMTHLFGIQ